MAIENCNKNSKSIIEAISTKIDLKETERNKVSTIVGIVIDNKVVNF